LQNLCIEIIERDNIGYDFGAYKDGILRYVDKLSTLETLIVANDSVIGPIYDMKDLHSIMQSKDCDFWGMNDFLKIKNPYLLVSHHHSNATCPMLTLTQFQMPLMKRDLIKKNHVNMSIFMSVLNMYEAQLTTIVTKNEILDEIGLNPRTKNSIFKWKQCIISNLTVQKIPLSLY
jgi:lipopolysaccharide biosynthesis protein